MDNILKLLLGVLAISGLIAFLVPSDDPIATAGKTSPKTATFGPAKKAIVSKEDDEKDEEQEDDDDDNEKVVEGEFRMGEPSIDGLPYGETEQATLNRPNYAPPIAADPLQAEPAPTIINGIVIPPSPADVPATSASNL